MHLGKAHVSYISSGKVIGLSKLNRIVQYYSHRPQVQERLTTQIFNELKEVLGTGVTTFYINSKIDEGDIIESKKIKIEKDENAGTLHDKLMTTGSKLVLKSVENIFNGNVKKKKQKISKKNKLAPKINKDICKINLNESAVASFGS